MLIILILILSCLRWADSTCLQRLTVPVVDNLIADLKECVREVKEASAAAQAQGGKGKKKKEGTMVALYGPYRFTFVVCCFRSEN